MSSLHGSCDLSTHEEVKLGNLLDYCNLARRIILTLAYRGLAFVCACVASNLFMRRIHDFLRRRPSTADNDMIMTGSGH